TAATPLLAPVKTSISSPPVTCSCVNSRSPSTRPPPRSSTAGPGVRSRYSTPPPRRTSRTCSTGSTSSSSTRPKQPRSSPGSAANATNGANPADDAQFLFDRAGTDVVITLGGDGLVFAGAAGTGSLPAHPIAPVDTTGAGDAFVGGLAAMLAEGEPLAAALE